MSAGPVMAELSVGSSAESLTESTEWSSNQPLAGGFRRRQSGLQTLPLCIEIMISVATCTRALSCLAQTGLAAFPLPGQVFPGALLPFPSAESGCERHAGLSELRSLLVDLWLEFTPLSTRIPST